MKKCKDESFFNEERVKDMCLDLNDIFAVATFIHGSLILASLKLAETRRLPMRVAAPSQRQLQAEVFFVV